MEYLANFTKSKIELCELWASWVVLVIKNPPANAGDLREASTNLGSGRSPAWQPIPLFLPGEFHIQRSLAGYIVHRVAKSRTEMT